MKLKDYVTLGNLIAGLGAVIALIEGDFDMACYLIFAAYIFDLLDGPVARITQQYDTFGAHLDTVCDFITNSIAAPYLIYYAFRHTANYSITLSALIASAPAILGTIRQAKGSDEELSFPCYFLGLPRPASALFFIALINSSLWRNEHLTAEWGGLIYLSSAVIIITISALHLSYIPFNGNKSRRWLNMMWVGKHAFLTISPIVFILGMIYDTPEVIFDYICFCLFHFIFLSWTQIPRGDFKRVRHYLTTREVIRPLIHIESTWRPQHFLLPILDDTTEWDGELFEREGATERPHQL